MNTVRTFVKWADVFVAYALMLLVLLLTAFIKEWPMSWFPLSLEMTLRIVGVAVAITAALIPARPMPLGKILIPIVFATIAYKNLSMWNLPADYLQSDTGQLKIPITILALTAGSGILLWVKPYKTEQEA